MLPDVISIDGVDYIRDEVARRRYAIQGADPESWMKVSQLAKEFYLNPHRIYDAINAGEIPARKPAGAARGWRVRRCDFVRWLDTWDAAAQV